MIQHPTEDLYGSKLRNRSLKNRQIRVGLAFLVEIIESLLIFSLKGNVHYFGKYLQERHVFFDFQVKSRLNLIGSKRKSLKKQVARCANAFIQINTCLNFQLKTI